MGIGPLGLLNSVPAAGSAWEARVSSVWKWPSSVNVVSLLGRNVKAGAMNTRSSWMKSTWVSASRTSPVRR
jgi:hypothetical protein